LKPKYDADYSYIDKNQALEEMLPRLKSCKVAAIDIEADSLHSYYEKVCLIQVGLNDENYIVDPLAGLDLAEFLNVLANKDILLHSVDYDLRMLRRSFGFRPKRSVYDTMCAAQLLGLEQKGLAGLIERFFGVVMCKRNKKSDWSRRPLSEDQLQYAGDDTRYLASLAEILHERLRQLHRYEWYRESCECAVEATAEDVSRDAENAWRIRGLKGLGRSQLAYVRGLWNWREKEARRADLPPFKILGNSRLIEIAVWADINPNAPLGAGPALPRNYRGKRLAAIEKVIRNVGDMAESQWPEFRRPQRNPLAPLSGRKVERLKNACARLAEKLNIEAPVLASRATIEAIVRKHSGSVEEIVVDGLLMKWQAKLLAQDIHTLFRQKALRRGSGP